MGQTRGEIDQNLAERLWWQAARRDDSRVAGRLYRKQVVDGVFRLDEGALLDDFFDFLHELGVVNLLDNVQGTAVQREMVPVVQYVLLYSMKTLFGVDSMNALPPVLFSDEALMRLVGFKAQQVRQGVCQRGAAQRQGARPNGRGRGPTAGATHHRPQLSGHAGRAHRAAERARPGGLVQRRHPGPGADWGVCH